MSSSKPKGSLKDIVRISPYYQRSILLNSDVKSSDAITGYVCHETAKKLLENLSQQVVLGNQRAFTWTGPFGTGKSILALALAAAISGKKKQRTEASEILEVHDIEYFNDAFPLTSKGWLVLPIVGTNASIFSVLSEQLFKSTGLHSSSSSELLSNLSNTVESDKYDGVLLVVDEMGKFLEASESVGEDIYFFQELAELTSRVKGNFTLIGILHQAFRQYARTRNFTEKVQNDWAKVQGRFVDLPFVTSSDEVVELIGNAINLTKEIKLDKDINERVSEGLKKRRPAVSADLSDKLLACWPLHPVTTLILGPASRKQFGQNERSIFGFLGSMEPYGFQEFLTVSSDARTSYYKPENYWDYLKANLEPAIISSLDSHRWSVAVEALDRVEAKGDKLHSSLLKNIAIIDLFKNGTGLAADRALLQTLYPDVSVERIEQALLDLSSWKAIVYRKFNDAWSIFEGSDFDIESAINQSLSKHTALDPHTIAEVANFHPVLAKRHLHETGTLRWMGITISSYEYLDKYLKGFKSSNGEFGQFVLLLDVEPEEVKQKCLELSGLVKKKGAVFALGVPKRSSKILELARELTALKDVFNRPELSGDSIARKEVTARMATVRNYLEVELDEAANQTQWLCDGLVDENDSLHLSKLASRFADRLFHEAPKIHSELVNREVLSSSSVKARKDLLHKMLSSEAFENLSIAGFPAEKGLYLTCLHATGIHRKRSDSDDWFFDSPDKSDRNLSPAWQAAIDLVVSKEGSVPCSDIYQLWSNPPFGIKSGMMPILLWALLLANKDKIALYKEGFYVPEPSDLDIDVSLQNISKFELKGIQLTTERLELLEAIAGVLRGHLGELQFTDPLNAARGLVRIIYSLPGWVRKTRNVSNQAMKFRDCILRATDPHKVLFHELQVIFKTDSVDEIAKNLHSVLNELTTKNDQLFDSLLDLFFEQLNSSKDSRQKLFDRAKNIQNTGQPFVNAFVNRVLEFDGSFNSLMDIYALLASKQFEDWNDQDIQNARNKLTIAARDFRELEVVVQVNQRAPSRQALAIVYGSSPGKDFVTRFDSFEADSDELERLSGELIKGLRKSDIDVDTQFAVLAQTIETLYKEKGKSRG